MDSYESVLLVKPEVFVFTIPPRTTNRGYRAADWNLSEPTWTGRLRLVTKDGKCSVKLEDKTKGELFAECPIDTYPGIAIEPVTDSSRYFVLRIQDGNGRSAFIGLGFGDRSDSFDLNVALQDHFKWVKKEQQLESEPEGPELDLRFKEGETIKINMKITKKDGSETTTKSKNRTGGGTSGVLAPPPGSNKIAPPPPSGSNRVTPTVSPSHSAAVKPESSESNNQNWSDFMSSSSDPKNVTPASPASTTNWVQF